MNAPKHQFILFLGSTIFESSINRLKASRVAYISKRLDSGPGNWQKIIHLLRDPNLLGVVTKLTSSNIDLMAAPSHRPLAETLFKHIGEARHIVLVYESILAPNDGLKELTAAPSPQHDRIELLKKATSAEDIETYLEAGGTLFEEFRFSPPDPDSLTFAKAMFAKNSVHLVPYKTNAELAVLADGFVEQTDKHLLFRIYVPRGRLWAEEADKLLSLFRDWLMRIRGSRVRQGGYTTGQGRIYEFFGDDLGNGVSVSKQFNEFSTFLDVCMRSPEEATKLLAKEGLNEAEVHEIITRYSKEARRIRVDLRQARESRVLSLRHRLEDELTEAGLSEDYVAHLADSIVPWVDDFTSALSGPRPIWRIESSGPLNINLTRQTIETVNGIVTQQLHGTAHIGSEPKKILELIEEHGGDLRSDLTSAVHELEDDDAQPQDRISARQRIKTFLFGLGSRAADVGTGVLVKYLETRLGLGG